MTDQSLYGFDDDDVGGPEANHLLIATGHACQLSPGKGGKTCTKLNELHRPNILAVYQKKYNKTHGFVIVSAKCGKNTHDKYFKALRDRHGVLACTLTPFSYTTQKQAI